MEDYHKKLKGSESIGTFGGESYIDGFEFNEYGISFGDNSIYGLSPEQMIRLVCIATDHLILNGHEFEIQETHEQDQRKRLICVDNKTIAS